MRVYTEVYAGLGNIIQSKYVPMMSLVCGGDINQSDFVGLCRSTWRSMWVYAEVYVGLCGGLCGSTQRSTWVYAGLGNIIQSKYVPMMSLAVVGTITNQILWVYPGLRGGLHRSTRVYMGVYAGLGNIIQSKSVTVMSLSVVRSIKCPPLFVPGYHWLPLATIDIVGDNMEFEV